MLKRHGAITAFAVITICSAATAAVAPNATTMAECKLVYEVARVEMKKLKVIAEQDYSDEFADDLRTEYRAGALRPSGLAATGLEFIDYVDPDISDHTLKTRLSASYDSAKPKLLRAHGLAQCKPESGSAGKRVCKLFEKPDGGKHELRASLQEAPTGSTIVCLYMD